MCLLYYLTAQLLPGYLICMRRESDCVGYMQQSITMGGEDAASTQSISARVLDMHVLMNNVCAAYDTVMMPQGAEYKEHLHLRPSLTATCGSCILISPYVSAGSNPWPACFHRSVMTQASSFLVCSWKLPY